MNNSKIYDAIDMRDNYNRGYWLGVLTGTIGMFTLCLLLGMYSVGVFG